MFGSEVGNVADVGENPSRADLRDDGRAIMDLVSGEQGVMLLD